MQTFLFGLLSRFRYALPRLLRSAPFDDSDEPESPRSGVRVPLRGGPSDLTSALALSEPEEASAGVSAVSQLTPR
jgi:hypothetical protein